MSQPHEPRWYQDRDQATAVAVMRDGKMLPTDTGITVIRRAETQHPGELTLFEYITEDGSWSSEYGRYYHFLDVREPLEDTPQKTE